MQSKAYRVTRVRPLGGESFVLEVTGEFPAVRGGQFCMVRTLRDWPVLLSRPFSYFDVTDDGATLICKAIGPGTRRLAALDPGEEILVTGPLGLGFPAAAEREPLCIAGGVGIAPFLLWTKERGAAGGGPVDVLFGGATAAAIVGQDDFCATARFHLATDDGSLGFCGNVLGLYDSLIASGTVDAAAPIYCCGPEPMMKAVASRAAERGVACHVSLETYMACGYGVCNGCSVSVASAGRFVGKRYAKSCIAGPVFATEELAW